QWNHQNTYQNQIFYVPHGQSPLSQIRPSNRELPDLSSPDLSPETPTYLNSPLTEKLQVPQWLISATPPEFNHLQTIRRLGFEQYFARLVLHDVARDRTRGNGQR